MAHAFLREFCQENKKEARTLSRSALDAIKAYSWPGNVRQLRTAIEHGVVMSSSSVVEISDLPDYLFPSSVDRASGETDSPPNVVLDSAPTFNLQYLERQTILKALQHTQGNRSAAAALLGINRRTLQRKMAENPVIFHQYLS